MGALHLLVLSALLIIMVNGVPSPQLLPGVNNGNTFCEESMTCQRILGNDEGQTFLCYKKKAVQVIGCGTVDRGYQLDSRTGHCYKFHTQGQTWPRAFLTCAAEGAHLAVINSAVEADVLRQLYANFPSSAISAQHPDVAQIGFLDLYSNRSWRTIFGHGLAESGYEQWASGEPNNDSNNQYCGGMYRSGHLDDTYCDRTFPFICEKEISN